MSERQTVKVSKKTKLENKQKNKYSHLPTPESKKQIEDYKKYSKSHVNTHHYDIVD